MFRADGPPLHPSAAHAHELLAQELSKPAYHDQSSPIIRVIAWSRDQLQRLLADSAGRLPPVLLVVVVLVVVAIIAVTVPRLRRSKRRVKAAAGGGVLTGESADADELRRRAAAAMGRGRYGDALTDYFRAVARSSEERALVQVAPGSTAHEIALELHTLFPAEGRALLDAAGEFDRVCYGGATADPGSAGAVRDLDHRLAQARPTHPDRLVAQ
ncbi:DUF4129 domain-containing protein [Leekyejoonella antrihumi]|uniref:DUF4129 domain-containing protein n=1 Tax=Leekyejoonella antrihumi TaxID=1660198 RepID=A0A563DU19_9MICO|nr:DUF4129 domain-containing protein [Leekyejoonella antrihumi]TWP33431.1 DUF4129 domain-containing protein [Leekyejoonella antrihumi]